MPHWNENLFPPSGFVFVDAEAIRHVGNNLSDLISRVAAYRTRRGLPPGNPISEVNAYLCNLFPNRCLKGPPATPGVVKASGISFGAKIASWLRGMWLKVSQKQVEFVDEGEVKRRAAICEKCSFFTRFPTECQACSDTFNQISFQLRAGRDKHTSNLKACAKFGSDLRVDVLVAQPPQPTAPENCWKR